MCILSFENPEDYITTNTAKEGLNLEYFTDITRAEGAEGIIKETEKKPNLIKIKEPTEEQPNE